ncbi:MAG TPA: hypothetical protein VF548_02785 [Allosphingosinicella sp.]|jgi:hypothetical protein
MWERVSYFITAVAAVLGWLITHYVDRVTDTPTIEYTIDEKTTSSGLEVVYRVTNVNRTHAYGPIKVSFLAADASPISSKLKVRSVEPADEGSEPTITYPDSAQYTVAKMMPGSRVRLDLAVRGATRPHIYLSSTNPDEAIRFTRRSLDTWVATHETSIVLVLIFVWAAVLVGLVLFAFLRGDAGAVPSKKKSPEGGTNA